MTPSPSDAAPRTPSVGYALTAVLCSALLACASAPPDPPSSQTDQGQPSGRTRVLVPPLQTSSGVDRDFGSDVAKRVRQRLGSFDVLTAVTGAEIEDATKEFDLAPSEMTPAQWRQLAGQVNAGLILFGEATPGSDGGVDVEMQFVDASTGDELRSPGFSVDRDGGNGRRAAADMIANTLDSQVAFQRSLLFCEDYVGAGQYEDALRNCNKALGINGNSTRGRMIRGRIYREQQQWEKARQDFAVVVENDESNPDALQNLAYVNAQLGNTERATALYRTYLNFNPDDAQIRLNVAYNLASAGGLDDALGLLEEGVRRDSTNANLWKYLGDVALRKGTTGSGRNVQGEGAGVEDTASLRTAVDAYERVLELRGDSASPDLIRNTIAAQMQMGNLQEGLDLANRALESRPDDADLLDLKARILARQKEYSAAAGVMDSVIALDPEYDRAYLRRGNYRLQSGASVEEVMADFEQAVENGTDGNVVANRMLAIGHNDYFQDGDLRTAARVFEAGLQFAESGSEAANQLHFFLGYGAYRQGEQLDKQNAEEVCEPAERALARFEQATRHLRQAGGYQAGSRRKLTKAADDYAYRQSQIIKKAC